MCISTRAVLLRCVRRRRFAVERRGTLTSCLWRCDFEEAEAQEEEVMGEENGKGRFASLTRSRLPQQSYTQIYWVLPLVAVSSSRAGDTLAVSEVLSHEVVVMESRSHSRETMTGFFRLLWLSLKSVNCRRLWLDRDSARWVSLHLGLYESCRTRVNGCSVRPSLTCLENQLICSITSIYKWIK